MNPNNNNNNKMKMQWMIKPTWLEMIIITFSFIIIAFHAQNQSQNIN